MLRSLALSALVFGVFGAFAPSAFATKAESTQPGRIAKAAYERKTGQKLAHTREIYSFDSRGNHYKMKVMGWNGAVRGPGAKDVFMFIVPSGSNRERMISKTKMTGNLENAGRRRVAAHLRA